MTGKRERPCSLTLVEWERALKNQDNMLPFKRPESGVEPFPWLSGRPASVRDATLLPSAMLVGRTASKTGSAVAIAELVLHGTSYL